MTAAILKWALFYSTTAKRRKTWYTKKASFHSSKYKKIQFWKTGYLPHLLTVSLLFQANKLLIEILDQYQYWSEISFCPGDKGWGHHVKQGNSIFFLQLTLYV